MLNQTQQNHIADQIAELPPAYQDVFNSIDWNGEILQVGQRNRLNYEQLQKFVSETTLVLIGLEDPNDYLNNIIKHMNISLSLGTQLQQEVEQDIFIPMNRLLQSRLGDAYGQASLEDEYVDTDELAGGLGAVGIGVESVPSPVSSDAPSDVPVPYSAENDPYLEAVE